MDKLTNLPIFKLRDSKRYSKYYNESDFWKKIKRIGSKMGKTTLRPILLLFFLMQDKNVPFHEKAYIIGALGYFIIPIDVLPDFIAGLGFTDDIAVVGLLLKHLKDCITPEIEKRADEKLNELFPD